MDAIVVAIISAAAVIVGAIISSIISSRKTNSMIELSEAHLEKGHVTLSGEHDKLSNEHNKLSNEHDKLKSELMHANETLNGNLSVINKSTTFLEENKKIEIALGSKLSKQELDIKATIDQLNYMVKQLALCHEKIAQLEMENILLSSQLSKIRTAQKNREDYEDEPER